MMKAYSPALMLYIISGILFFISSVVGNEYLVFVSKPVIISSILFYYWQNSKGKVNLWFSLILVLLLFSGILNLFEDEKALMYVILVNLVAYSIILGHVIQRLFLVNFRVIDTINISVILLTILLMGCVLYLSLFLIFDKNSELYIFITIYSIVLVTLAIASTGLTILKPNQSNLSLMTAMFCFVVSDLFYVIYYYYYNFILFRYGSIFSNIISSYFLVQFFLHSVNDAKKEL